MNLSTKALLVVGITLGGNFISLQGATAACASEQEAVAQAAAAKAQDKNTPKIDLNNVTLHFLLHGIEPAFNEIAKRKCTSTEKGDAYRQELLPCMALYYHGNMRQAKSPMPLLIIEAYLNKMLAQHGMKWLMDHYRNDCKKNLTQTRHLCGWNDAARQDNWQDQQWSLPCCEDDGFWRPLQFTHEECTHMLPALMESEIVQGVMSYYVEMEKFYEQAQGSNRLIYWGLPREHKVQKEITAATILSSYKDDQDKAKQDLKAKRPVDLSGSALIAKLKKHADYAHYIDTLYKKLPSHDITELVEKAQKEKTPLLYEQRYQELFKSVLDAQLARDPDQQARDTDQLARLATRMLFRLYGSKTPPRGNDAVYCDRACTMAANAMMVPPVFRNIEAIIPGGVSYTDIASQLLLVLIDAKILHEAFDITMSKEKLCALTGAIQDFIALSVDSTIRHDRKDRIKGRYEGWLQEREALMREYNDRIATDLEPYFLEARKVIGQHQERKEQERLAAVRAKRLQEKAAQAARAAELRQQQEREEQERLEVARAKRLQEEAAQAARAAELRQQREREEAAAAKRLQEEAAAQAARAAELRQQQARQVAAAAATKRVKEKAAAQAARAAELRQQREREEAVAAQRVKEEAAAQAARAAELRQQREREEAAAAQRVKEEAAQAARAAEQERQQQEAAAQAARAAEQGSVQNCASCQKYLQQMQTVHQRAQEMKEFINSPLCVARRQHNPYAKTTIVCRHQHEVRLEHEDFYEHDDFGQGDSGYYAGTAASATAVAAFAGAEQYGAAGAVVPFARPRATDHMPAYFSRLMPQGHAYPMHRRAFPAVAAAASSAPHRHRGMPQVAPRGPYRPAGVMQQHPQQSLRATVLAEAPETPVALEAPVARVPQQLPTPAEVGVSGSPEWCWYRSAEQQ